MSHYIAEFPNVGQILRETNPWASYFQKHHAQLTFLSWHDRLRFFRTVKERLQKLLEQEGASANSISFPKLWSLVDTCRIQTVNVNSPSEDEVQLILKGRGSCFVTVCHALESAIKGYYAKHNKRQSFRNKLIELCEDWGIRAGLDDSYLLTVGPLERFYIFKLYFNIDCPENPQQERYRPTAEGPLKQTFLKTRLAPVLCDDIQILTQVANELGADRDDKLHHLKFICRQFFYLYLVTKESWFHNENLPISPDDTIFYDMIRNAETDIQSAVLRCGWTYQVGDANQIHAYMKAIQQETDANKSYKLFTVLQKRCIYWKDPEIENMYITDFPFLFFWKYRKFYSNTYSENLDAACCENIVRDHVGDVYLILAWIYVGILKLDLSISSYPEFTRHANNSQSMKSLYENISVSGKIYSVLITLYKSIDWLQIWKKIPQYSFLEDVVQDIIKMQIVSRFNTLISIPSEY